jgi:hypothetical protein
MATAIRLAALAFALACIGYTASIELPDEYQQQINEANQLARGE